MPKWLKKSLVLLISVLTFGLVTPPQTLLLDQVDAKNSNSHELEKLVNKSEIFTGESQTAVENHLQVDKEKWLQTQMKNAEAQSFVKFGDKIKPQIENEFRDIILPNIEKAISSVAEQYQDEDLLQLTVTQLPGKGKSEKIFHITNQSNGKDVIRFHVRRDHPPQQGYWFNFHYHTYHDKFQTHHDLGSIYWAKNTPPNWMS